MTEHQDQKYQNSSRNEVLIKNHINKGYVGVEYCPTEKIWDDLLNKPKQGKDFRSFRGELMNVGINYGYNNNKTNTSDYIAGEEA